MNLLKIIGDRALGVWSAGCRIGAVVWSVLRLAPDPRSWPRTVRDQLARQILFTGIEALGLTLIIAVAAGVSIVAQAQLWLKVVGQTEMLSSLLVATIVREVGPLLVNLVVIGRSGSAIATEMATMRVRREIDVLDAQGVDPMIYLVMPRVIGVAVSVFGLTVIFTAVSLGFGYMGGLLLGVTSGDPALFASRILAAVSPADVTSFLAKTLLPGLLTGAICTLEGVRVQAAATEIPRAATRGVVRSMAAVVLVSAVVSVLIYA